MSVFSKSFGYWVRVGHLELGWYRAGWSLTPVRWFTSSLVPELEQAIFTAP